MVHDGQVNDARWGTLQRTRNQHGLLSTFLAMAGLEASETPIDGENHLPLLRNDGDKRRRLFFHFQITLGTWTIALVRLSVRANGSCFATTMMVLWNSTTLTKTK